MERFHKQAESLKNHGGEERHAVAFAYVAEEYKVCELAGVSMRDYYEDVRLMVSAQKGVFRMLAETLDVPEQGHALSCGHVTGPAAIGCEVHWPEDDEPAVRAPLLRDIEQVPRFRPAEPPDQPFVVSLLRKAKQFHDLTGIRASVCFEGPFTTAAFVRGQTEFLTDVAENPSLCVLLMEKITDFMIQWRQYHDAEMGISEADSTALTDDSLFLISPALFDALVLPHILRWYEAFPSPRRRFHCCGPVERHLASIRKMALFAYDAMGEMVKPAWAKEMLPGVHISQLYDFRLIRDGTPEQIVAETVRVCEAGSPGNRYGVYLEGHRGVPLQRARLVRDAVASFNGGTLPTSYEDGLTQRREDAEEDTPF